MNARIAKIKKHFRDNYKTYIGAVVGLAAGVAAGLVIVSKINSDKKKQGSQMSSAEVDSLEKELTEFITEVLEEDEKRIGEASVRAAIQDGDLV